MSSKIPKAEVLERIRELFADASKNPEHGDRFVKAARKIGMKANVVIPRELKKRFCRQCNSYFCRGNYRVRTRNGYLVYSCFNCKRYSKYKI